MINSLSSQKLFLEINTVKTYVHYILNHLRKNVPDAIDIVDIVDKIVNGQTSADLPQEVIILDALLNHPERFVKNLNAQDRALIHAEVKLILEDFLEKSKYINQSLPALIIN